MIDDDQKEAFNSTIARMVLSEQLLGARTCRIDKEGRAQHTFVCLQG
jgi:hypothetical protein